MSSYLTIFTFLFVKVWVYFQIKKYILRLLTIWDGCVTTKGGWTSIESLIFTKGTFVRRVILIFAMGIVSASGDWNWVEWIHLSSWFSTDTLTDSSSFMAVVVISDVSPLEISISYCSKYGMSFKKNIYHQLFIYNLNFIL